MKSILHELLLFTISSVLLFTMFEVCNAEKQTTRNQATVIKNLPRRKARAATPKSAKWYPFISPDGDFIVKVPGKPIREPDIYGLGGTFRGYSLVKDFVHFQIMFHDTGIEPNNLEGDKLPLDFGEIRIKDIEGKGGTIIRSQLLRINVHELEAWIPYKKHPGQSLHFIEHFIIRNGQLYMLSCTSLIPDQKLDMAIYRRFFDSLRVIKVPQPQ